MCSALALTKKGILFLELLKIILNYELKYEKKNMHICSMCSFDTCLSLTILGKNFDNQVKNDSSMPRISQENVENQFWDLWHLTISGMLQLLQIFLLK